VDADECFDDDDGGGSVVDDAKSNDELFLCKINEEQ
jgi:hypothetical protein